MDCGCVFFLHKNRNKHVLGTWRNTMHLLWFELQMCNLIYRCTYISNCRCWCWNLWEHCFWVQINRKMYQLWTDHVSELPQHISGSPDILSPCSTTAYQKFLPHHPFWTVLQTLNTVVIEEWKHCLQYRNDDDIPYANAKLIKMLKGLKKVWILKA